MIRWKKIYPRDLQNPILQANLNKYLRAGCVVAVDAERGVCDVQWFDRPGIRKDVLITQANDKDWYVPEVGSYVIVGFDSKEQARILRYISRGHATRVKSQHSLPKLKPGESIREVGGTIFYMKSNGDVVLLTPDQNKIQLEASTGTLSTDTINIRNTSEAGVSFMGVIKRMITSLGVKSLQFVKNTAGKYLTEYKLQISETADLAVGTNADPIIDVAAGTVINDDGEAIDHSGTVTTVDSNDALCLDLTIQRNSVELLALKVSKDGHIYINMAEEVLMQLAKKLLVTAQEIVLNNGNKGAARLDDTIEATIPAGSFWISDNTPNPNSITINGKITSSSSTVKVG